MVQGQDGEPWFVASDVAGVLGYGHTPNMVRNLDKEDISVHNVSRNQKGNPNISIINESGLYTAVLNCRKPEAKQFKRWVTTDILPTIRERAAKANNRSASYPA